MLKEGVCFGLFRLLLPAALAAACVLRINGFSLLYGCLLLLEPVMPRPTVASMAGSSGWYLILTVTCCSLTLLAQIVFQAYLLISATEAHPYGSQLTNCSHLEKTLRQLGLQRLEQDDFANILRIILPDIGAFLIALIVLIFCRVLLSSPQNQSIASDITPPPSVLRQRLMRHTGNLGNIILNLLVIIFLALSGIAKPSLLSSVYLVTFLAVCTWLALSRGLGRGFVTVQIILMVYSAAHLILLYLYQFQFFQEAVPVNGFAPRLVGLTGIVRTDCRKPWLLFFYDVEWPVYASPGVILLLYFTMASEVRRWFTRIKHLEETGQLSGRKGLGRRTSQSSERQVLHDDDRDDGDESLVASGPARPRYSSMDQTSVQLYQDNDGQSVGMTSDGDGHKDTHKKRTALESIGVYIMRQSYVGTLIIMMAWSITYHSWLTFVLLIWACIIWLIPSKRTVCLHCSPVIVVYAICLIILQYIWGLDVSLPETTPSGFKLNDLGLQRFIHPCLPLGGQILFTVMFWITMRQFMQEWRKQHEDNFMDDLALQLVDANEATDNTAMIHHQPDVNDGQDGEDGDAVKAVGRYIWHIFCKYWILVCTAMFLLMALQEAVIYRIIYMVLFLYFMISFLICYSWWRFTITVFWWVVIVYSMIVVSVVYTYQFEGFIPWGWLNNTDLSHELLADIGLEKFDTGTLFVKLLTPTAFLIIIIIQLHYFQQPFLQLSDVNRLRGPRPKRRWFWQKKQGSAHTSTAEVRDEEAETGQDDGEATAEDDQQPTTSTEQEQPPQPPKPKNWRERFVRAFSHAWHTLYGMLDAISALLWRLMEVHIVKAVMFTIFICCLVEVTAVNVVLVILIIIGVTSPRLHSFMSYVSACWIGLVILAKMTYQLSFVHVEDGLSNCTAIDNHTLPYPFNSTINSALYVGLEKRSNVADYLKNYIIIILLLGLEGVVRIHQQQHWGHPNRKKPYAGIIFPNTKRSDADKGLVQCAQYFVNYTFYKFGLQLCFVMTMITMVVRLDGYSVLYGVFLGILLLLNRRVCYRIWPIYMLVLIVLLALQYLACLGVPPALCWEYPWDDFGWMTNNLKIFLYLPNYVNPPIPMKLLADFFQLLLVCLQWWVFQLENSNEWESYGGGSNSSILDEVERDEPNPVDDFLSYKDSYLDYLKAIVFQYSFWVTLLVVFIAGTSRISLFCLGYLVACFFFFWFGQELLLKPLRNLLRLWGFLLGYNYFVLLAKSGLQLVGCVYRDKLVDNYCWLIQLFSILCLRSGNYNTEDNYTQSKCKLDDDEAGLTWDAICFVFLLLMLRVYKSHYFRHVVRELEVQNSLAARGAELINTSLIKRVAEQKSREDVTLTKIKKKMDRIKMRQAKLQTKAVVESDDHYVGRPQPSHLTIIRSGDYYMFEDDSDEDEVSSVGSVDIGPDPTSSDHEDDDKVSPLQIIDAAIKSGTKEALEVAERRPSRHTRTSECDSDTDERPSSRRHSHRISDPPASPGSPAIIHVKTGGATGGGDEYDGDKEPSDHGSEDGDKPAKKEGSKIVNWLKLLWAIICGFLDYLISFLRNISREYRSVSRILDREKEQEKRRLRKEKEESGEASGDTAESKSQSDTDGSGASKSIATRPSEISLQIDKEEQDVAMLQRELDIDTKKDAEKEFERGMPRLLQLVAAAVEVLLSRSDWLCYFAMILNVLVSASLLSLPYPFSVFLWALLSVPRPSKTYWVTIITYTEAVVVVKYLFQFGFFPWNDSPPVKETQFWPPTIIGIEKKSNYAVFDLILLFCLFVHRSVLKRYGLWRDAIDIEEDFAKAERNITSPVGSPTEDVPAISVYSEDEDAAGVGSDNATFEAASSQEDLPDPPTKANKDSKDGKKKKGLLSSVFTPFKMFYQQMTNPRYNAVTDVYAPMFLCDFITFVIVVFGYASFGPSATSGGAETVANVIQENKVPPLFLAMLLVQFVLIIIDRALYLRKLVLGKFLFQIFLVILVHTWLFFILPAVTNRAFTDNVPAQLWYFTKCIYFGLSAYQIRSAYPTRILGNFLTKKFNYANLFLFKGFLLIPFLLELRALMDWMWTDTTLALTSWLQMEDIYANIFVLKCWRRAERDYPTPRGQKRRAGIKYGVGGLLLFVLIFIIWFPLLLFSLSSAIFQPNPPIDCSIEMKFGGYQPIFQMSAQQQNIYTITDDQYNLLQDYYKDDKAAAAFIAGYQREDVFVARLAGNSTATWDISPPSLKALNYSLINDTEVKLFVTVSFTRNPSSGATSDTVSRQFVRILSQHSATDMQIRNRLSRMLNGTEDKPVSMSQVYPSFMTVSVSKSPEQSSPIIGPGSSGFSGVNFTLRNEKTTHVHWWELASHPVPAISTANDKDLYIVSFNERIAPGAFTFLTSYGVIGLYVSVVIVIGQFVRIFFSGTSNRIMFEQLPTVDRIYHLCMDIYLVRESYDYCLEEELYSKLIFLYRSPETMIKWTKIKTS